MAGWHRARTPDRLTTWPVRTYPDWVCEIVSLNHARRDFVIKPRTLHTTAVPHYWLLYPEAKVLLVHRWAAEGYTVVLAANSGERVRAEPFSAIEIDVSELFGDEVDDPAIRAGERVEPTAPASE